MFPSAVLKLGCWWWWVFVVFCSEICGLPYVVAVCDAVYLSGGCLAKRPFVTQVAKDGCVSYCGWVLLVLRSILGIRWQDRVTNTEVFKRTDCISIEAVLLKSCLRWTGHVIRMEDHRIPKQLLFGELEQGHRRQGRPCKRFKDTVKAGLKWCGIPPTEPVATALDSQRWRTLSQSASSALEEERRHQAQSARERRHLATSIPATNANFQCSYCTRLCKSRIGPQSHSRTHR